MKSINARRLREYHCEGPREREKKSRRRREIYIRKGMRGVEREREQTRIMRHRLLLYISALRNGVVYSGERRRCCFCCCVLGGY